MVAATEATLTTAPPLPAGPSGFMARNACFMPSAAPTTLTSHMRRRSCASTLMTSDVISTPALFTRMSKPPNSAIVAETAACQLASSVTSRVTKAALAPPVAIALAVSRPTSVNTSPIITAAPALERAAAMPAPRPRAPPVTSAFRPARSNLLIERFLPGLNYAAAAARSSRAVGRLHHVGGSGERRGSPISPRRRIELTLSPWLPPCRNRPSCGAELGDEKF